MNGTIANRVLHDIDLYFQGQTCFCYAFAFKINVQAEDVHGRFTSNCTVPAVKLLLFEIALILMHQFEQSFGRSKSKGNVNRSILLTHRSTSGPGYRQVSQLCRQCAIIFAKIHLDKLRSMAYTYDVNIT